MLKWFYLLLAAILLVVSVIITATSTGPVFYLAPILLGFAWVLTDAE